MVIFSSALRSRQPQLSHCVRQLTVELHRYIGLSRSLLTDSSQAQGIERSSNKSTNYTSHDRSSACLGSQGPSAFARSERTANLGCVGPACVAAVRGVRRVRVRSRLEGLSGYGGWISGGGGWVWPPVAAASQVLCVHTTRPTLDEREYEGVAQGESRAGAGES